MLSKAILGCTPPPSSGSSGPGEQYFSSTVYTGTGSTQSIYTEVDFDTYGGMVWIKKTSGTGDHYIFDTVRGATKYCLANSTAAEATLAGTLTAFTDNGFKVGNASSAVNDSGATYVAYSFRKQAGFFDAVTFTTSGVGGASVPHSLGAVPGAMLYRRLDTTADWWFNHRSLSDATALKLNTNGATFGTGFSFSSAAGSSTITFPNGTLIANTTYVMYLFAHNSYVFGPNSNESIIHCGTHSGSGSTGWESELILMKPATTAATDWYLLDSSRGLANNNGSAHYLSPNTTAGQVVAGAFTIDSTGFTDGWLGYASTAFIAIRKQLYKQPTEGTQVFSAIAQTGTGAVTPITTGFPVDMVMSRQYAANNTYNSVVDRLRGVSSAGRGTGLLTQLSQLEGNSTYPNEYHSFDQTGITVGTGPNQIGNASSAFSMLYHLFRRAKGFFDVVLYTGNGSSRSINHSLAVTPELMIHKGRNATSNWLVYAQPLGLTKYLYVDIDSAEVNGDLWGSAPTSTTFSTRGAGYGLNETNVKYLTYLFASCPGVSKIGSYTGTGTSPQNIDCGFTTGARYVLIKCTSHTGAWWVADVARGITTGDDKLIALDATTLQLTYNDLTPYSAGFTINATNTTGNSGVNNTLGRTYIYLAIA